MREKLHKTTNELEYIAKWNAEADLAGADPDVNTSFSEAELSEMQVQFHVGYDPFVIPAN